ncbi:MAG: helix-turn-helix domain-containing protein [Christensenellaceae bacterium]|nr:helix-turn-helix domain-containing protein [Christensenellaceae bacterium]
MKYTNWRSRTFKHWFLCFILVLVIPVVFFAIYFARSQALLERKLHESNITTIRQVGSMFDEWFSQIKDIEDNIAISPDIQKISNISLPFDAHQYYRLHTYSRSLSDYARQGIVGSVYLYYSSMNCLLDGARIFTENNQLDNVIANRLGVSSDWFFDQVSTFQNYAFFSADHHSIISLKSLDIGKNPKLTVIIKLNTRSAEELLSSVEASCGGNAYVLFENGERFGASAEEGATIPYDELLSLSGETPATIDGRLVSSTSSALPGIRYVITVPVNVYLRDLYALKRAFVWSVVGILLIGTLISMLLTRHNYQPVAELKRLANVAEAGSQDDFKQLNQKLAQLQQDSTRMQTQLSRLSTIVDDRMLHLLITGGYLNQDERHHLDKLKRTLQGVLFTATVIDVAAEDGQPDQRDGLLMNLKRRLREIIRENQQEGQWHGVVCVEGSQLGSILCFGPHLSSDDAQLATHDIANQMIRILSSEFPDINLRFFIGDACHHVDDIAVSYRHALDCMEYCSYLMQDTPDIVMYHPAMFTTSIAWNHYDAYDVERQFTDAMMAGDYKQGQKLLHDLISYYDYQDGTSVYVMRCRMFGLMNIMLNLFHEIAPDVDVSLYETSGIQERLLTAKTMTELKQTILGAFDQLIGMKDGRDDNDVRADGVIKYVARHYFEESLSVQQIADAFHVSLPFLSRRFKKETNSGMLDYINRYRIQKAKEMMLRDPEMTISDVAERVGYNSSQTLIRVFKRYESITPGQWKTNAAVSGDL